MGRTAKIGGLAAGQAIRQAGTHAANVARSPEGREAALERRHIEAAEQIVAALGTMKGAAMKLGQVMSFLDVGLVPEEYREEFQHKLAALRDAAPTVSFKQMRRVIEDELEDPLDKAFAEFEEEPIAAASIGQVYRARLLDGRRVAVKVQYPGVAAAVRADMQNLGLILRLAKRIAPGMDPQAIGEEIRDRIGEILFRFYFGCLYRHHQFSGDPHPGNSMLLDDGRMAFFDFGLFKRMPPGSVEVEIAIQRAVIEGDVDEVMRLGAETGLLPEPEKFRPERVLEHFRAATSWYTSDEDIQLSPEWATQVMIDMGDPRSEYFGQMRHETAPPDHIFGRRMEVLTLAVIAQLHARGNFHRIAREWFYGDPPATELGRQEAEFYAHAAA